MIAYKVVHKESRMGMNAALFGIEKTKALVARLPELERYFPKYKKGAKIDYVKGTPGICCFTSKKVAERFVMDECRLNINKELTIIKVEGFSVLRGRAKLYSGCGSDPRSMLDSRAVTRLRPKGFIGFKQIKVLE